jgi:5'-nucleotidase
MRILITNDDGITAPGLAVLDAIAQTLAGPGGEVWTVAPAFEQSGVSHALSYTRPMMIAELGPRRFAVEGSPTDCVLAGLYDVMAGRGPDLILSGVNRGNNSAENVVYSGTIGAAMEGALQGLPAIALSQYFGPGNHALADPFEAAAVHGTSVIRSILDKGLWDGSPYKVFYNVNFPPVAAAGVKGIRVAPQGLRTTTNMGIEAQIGPSGRRYLWIKGGSQTEPCAPGSDAQVNMEGYISVTPLRADLTAHDLIAPLQDRMV